MGYRHRVLALLFLLSIVTYLDRVCISVAGPAMQRDLGLSQSQWGIVVGIFALSYAIFEIPSGATVPIDEALHDGPAIGLDWFLLDLLLMTLIFSPIEVLWPAYPKQSVFRPEWLLDVGYAGDASFRSTLTPNGSRVSRAT